MRPGRTGAVGAVDLGLCVYVEGPFGKFISPYGPVQQAQDQVAAVGGDFARLDHGVYYEITLKGRNVTDQTLARLTPYFARLMNVQLTLADTAVSTAAAAACRNELPGSGNVFLESNGQVVTP